MDIPDIRIKDLDLILVTARAQCIVLLMMHMYNAFCARTFRVVVVLPVIIVAHAESEDASLCVVNLANSVGDVVGDVTAKDIFLVAMSIEQRSMQITFVHSKFVCVLCISVSQRCRYITD